MATPPPTTVAVQDEKKPSRFSPNGSDSEANTLAEREHDEVKANMPTVDWDRAATIKPSRLRGKGLMVMVTVIAGTGVSGNPCLLIEPRGCCL